MIGSFLKAHSLKELFKIDFTIFVGITVVNDLVDIFHLDGLKPTFLENAFDF